MKLPKFRLPKLGDLLGKIPWPRKLKDVGAIAYRNAPKACMVVGTGLLVYSVGKAIVVTYKGHDQIAEYGDKCKSIMAYKKEVAESPDPSEYTDREFLRDMWALGLEAVHNLGVMYWKPIGALTIGLTCHQFAYGTMAKWYERAFRDLGATVLAFTAYRENVVRAEGSEADSRYLLGIQEDTRREKVITTGDEDVVTNITTELVPANPPATTIHPYTFIFRHGNEYYDDTSNDMNVLRLINWEREFTHNLRIQGPNGHFFRDEIVRRMGGTQESGDIEYPRDGLVGWHMALGDGYIDFGIFDVDNDGIKHLKPSVRAYMQSHDDAIPLTLNCDGNIMPLLMKRNKEERND